MSQDIGTDRRIARVVGGRYQITGLIASGGMGEVFQAHDRVLDRTVALKVLHAGLGSDPDFIERFRKEATAAGRLSHPNIVQVYDWGRSEDGSAYMAMELVEGQNLREVLAASGRLRPALAARIAAQVCAALEAARKAGLVHRDIKPENILLTSEGMVKVADFGLSRTMAESKATQAGVLLGTAHYVAPEQVEGKESDHRSDLYALGIVLFEMLTGQTPFHGDTPVIVAYQRVRENVPAPSEQIAGVPEAMDQIVRRATDRDPEKRFRSAAEMGDALRTAMPRTDTGEVGMLVHPTVAIPIGTQETVNLGRKRGHRLTRRGVIVLVAVLALIAGSIPFLVGSLAHATVPSLAGQPKARAEQSLRAAGFAVNTDVENSSTVAEGHVIRTEPAGGTSARKGSTVTIIVSSGPVTVQVPDVRNMKYEQAKTKLEGLGLTVDRNDAYNATVRKGYVISQNKDPDVLVNTGTKILLIVSKGIQRILVPDVKGKTEADATQALTSAGFTVTPQHKDDDTVPAGQVISQTPDAGLRADKGSVVTIVVSNGPPKVAVPNLQCMTRKQASDVLASKGLQVKFMGSGRRVVDQDPQPGAQAARGSVVTAYTGPGTYC
ncbi:MAG: serine/threonine protein kinase [Actinobacteria bacterium]|nr:MAG: serine/threonine protein kinase [Actinomycetota bacterium]